MGGLGPGNACRMDPPTSRVEVRGGCFYIYGFGSGVVFLIQAKVFL